jgi:hypothetical protein
LLCSPTQAWTEA